MGALAAWVGGDDVRVQVLVPPRADPSTFEPSPRQLDNLADARAFLMVGGGMDDWVERIPGAVEGIPVTRVNEGLALREGGEGEGTGDPHTWLDPVLVRDAWLPRIVAQLAVARASGSRSAGERWPTPSPRWTRGCGSAWRRSRNGHAIWTGVQYRPVLSISSFYNNELRT